MSTPAAETGTVVSGDVSLWYRRFGAQGGLPAVILHGANYYDSRDWVQVASSLAADRPVCVYDARGFGLSGWSPSGDYSTMAQLSDLSAVLDHLDWKQAIVVGHSRGGGIALRYCGHAPSRVAGIVLVDFSPGRPPRRAPGGEPQAGSHGPTYPSLEAAHADMSRNPDELATETGRVRVESFLGQRAGGWVNIRRDPASQPGRGDRAAASVSVPPEPDLWEVLAQTLRRGALCQVIRATRSRSYDEATLARMAAEFPAVRVVAIDAGHDVVGTAYAALVECLSTLLADHDREGPRKWRHFC